RFSDQLVVLNAPESPIAEDFRRLRTNLHFAWGRSAAPITVLVTSSGPEEGKSVTSANLAIPCTRAEQRANLWDADFRHPSIHRLFELPNETGLSSLLWGDVVNARAVYAGPSQPFTDLRLVLRRRLEAVLLPSGVPGLRLLLAGPRASADAVDSIPTDDAEQLLEALGALADVIVMDAPPMLVAAETTSLAALRLGVAVVVEAGQTPADAARLTRDTLQHAGARMLGVVINKASSRNTAYYHLYRRRGVQHGVSGLTERILRR